MSENFQPRIFESAKVIAEKMLFAGPRNEALGKTIFFIGAGCSVTAGIPGAAKIAQRMTIEVGRRFRVCENDDDCLVAYRKLVEQNNLSSAAANAPIAKLSEDMVDWHHVYDEMFERHFATPDDVRDLFGDIVAEANGAINWAHLCLGELAATLYVSTVLTTNFDQLTLSGMVRAGILPVVCDGLESLNRIAGAPKHVQLVELHGSRHTYLLRNRPEDVKAIWHDPQASAAVQKLLQNATTFVVVGYGGREEGVMDLLVQAAKVYPDKNLFWVQHSPDPKILSAKAAEFLGTSRNGGLLIGQDADVFFLELCQALQVGTPTALSKPLSGIERLIEDIEASDVSNSDIRSEIARAKGQLESLAEASKLVGRAGTSAVVAIREKRLAGDYVAAYRLAKKALGK